MTAVAVQPIIVTADLDRLVRFYTGLLGAAETTRVPGEGGATFYVGLRAGAAELGLVADAAVDTGTAGRILLSIDVADVDGLLPKVEPLGGRVLAQPNDMPWGQRVAHIADPDGNAINLTHAI